MYFNTTRQTRTLEGPKLGAAIKRRNKLVHWPYSAVDDKRARIQCIWPLAYTMVTLLT